MKRKSINVYQGLEIISTSKKMYTFNLLQESKCDDLLKTCQSFLTAQDL